MEVSTRRMRNLEPARPLRRLNSHQVVTQVVAEPLENPRERPVNTIRVEHFNETLKLNSQRNAPEKPERISYSRNFLIKLANAPMAKKKPDFLPDHPVVLDKVREPDTHQLVGNNCAKVDMYCHLNNDSFRCWSFN
ncbi:uncharacterized protein C8orf88 homolog isoform X2 [Tachysurus vachellii]|uniref:uncharacterized protein C8orf88 homolog isoform X2 n=1 Tax=Tachysurus vachellii TaxID=175792 RepID=UPI00296AB314|nr:uncharacterized protein C8orf88 homolog isoform X2 [Tachysurus vachellii]XP_060725265.1 uncharacterized protein C8orf88 homolog isoform X2 [Tachysurus vachellii]XP_060725270.1 uncharacterized protein C8orf88 homolog isoform X2 [Tachysurus vachellii]